MPSHNHNHKPKKLEIVSDDGRRTGYIRERGKHAKPESGSRTVESFSRDRDAKRRDNDILKTVAKPDTETFVRLAAENPNNTYTRYKFHEQNTPSGEVVNRIDRIEKFKSVEKPVKRHDTFDTKRRTSEAKTSLPKRAYTVTDADFQIVDADPNLRASEPERFSDARRDFSPEHFTRTERYSNSQWGAEIKRSTSPEWDSDIERPTSLNRSSEQDHFTSSRKDFDSDENLRSRSFPEQDKGTKSYPLHRNLFAEVAEVKEQARTTFEQPQQTPVEKTSSSRSSKQAREKQPSPLADIFTRDDGTLRPANFERSRPTPDRVENTAPSTFPRQDKGTGSYPIGDIFKRNDGTPRPANFERFRPTPDPVENITPRSSPEPIKTETQPQRRDTAPTQTETQERRSDAEFPKPDTQPRRSKTEPQQYSEAGRSAAPRGFVPKETRHESNESNIEKTLYTPEGIKALNTQGKKELLKNSGSEELGTLGPKYVEALGETVLKQLSPEEVKGIARGLGFQGIANLNIRAINDLGPNLIEGLGPEKTEMLVRKLDPHRSGIVETSRLGRLNNEVITKLAQELGRGMIESLGVDLAHMMNSAMIKGLGSKGAQKVAKDIGPLIMEQLHPEIVQLLAQEIGPEGVGTIKRPEGRGQLGTKIIGTLTTPDAKAVIQDLGPAGIANLNPDARGDLINKITPEDLRTLIKALGPDEIQKLGHTWLGSLGPEVVKEVHTVFPDLLQKISADEEKRNPQYRIYMEAKREAEKRKAQRETQRQQSYNHSYPQGYEWSYSNYGYGDFYSTYRQERDSRENRSRTQRRYNPQR